MREEIPGPGSYAKEGGGNPIFKGKTTFGLAGMGGVEGEGRLEGGKWEGGGGEGRGRGGGIGGGPGPGDYEVGGGMRIGGGVRKKKDFLFIFDRF